MAADSREIDMRDISLDTTNIDYDIVTTEEATSINHMAFYQSDNSVNNEQSNIGGQTEGGIMKNINGGRTEQFLENRGFGWLLDTEEDELDSEKPLL